MDTNAAEIKFNVLRKLLASMAIDPQLYGRFTKDPKQVLTASNMPQDEMDDVLAAISTKNSGLLANAIGARGTVSCVVPEEV